MDHLKQELVTPEGHFSSVHHLIRIIFMILLSSSLYVHVNNSFGQLDA
jgi:hypothetical protein